jgi:hypothetical protein
MGLLVVSFWLLVKKAEGRRQKAEGREARGAEEAAKTQNS